MLLSAIRFRFATALVATLVLFTEPAAIDAWCSIALWNVYHGSTPLTSNPVNSPPSSLFAADRWPVTSATPTPPSQFPQPYPALLSYYGSTYNSAPDTCVGTCTPNVTVVFSMETIRNTFTIIIGNAAHGNWYLASTSGNTGPAWGWKQFTGTAIDGNTHGALPNDALFGNASQTWPGSSTATFGTTYTRLPSNDTYYGTDDLTGYGGLFPAIFQVPFPYWDCSNGGANYISILDTLANDCGPQLNQFAFTRSCGVKGDPQFSGLRGQSFQVHGIDGAVYNLISDSYLQLNSQFVFLTGPRDCPVIPSTGRPSVACFAHAGSYLGNLALRTSAGDRLIVQSGPASDGLAEVALNGRQLQVGDNVTLSFASGGLGYVSYLSSHEVDIRAGLFSLEVENSDSFLNLRSVVVHPEHWRELEKAKTHGLLGQTWQLLKKQRAIEGKVDDYLLESEDLFGTDFVYNRFAL